MALPLHITASQAGGETVTVYATAEITASATSRTLSGYAVRWGIPGRTSRGKLRVRAGALRFPDDLTRVKLTKEHDRGASRGYLASKVVDAVGIRAAMRVSDGPEGDAALQEAADKTRDGFSFDIVDAQVVGDEIVDGLVVAIGQVGIPAYDDTRIDSIAASQHPTQGEKMNDDQRARLAELRALTTRTAEQEAELSQLAALEAAEAQPPAPAAQPAAGTPAQPVAPSAAQPVEVAASFSAVPPGVPAPQSSGVQVTQTSPLQQFVDSIVAGYASGNPGTITAALGDITPANVGGVPAQPAWSGELWSGLGYTPEFTPLLASGTLTALKGEGWRFKTKPVMQDYAGNKAAIPTTTTDIEPSTWTASRMAVGNDFDRAFYDFPEQYAPILRGYIEFVRESWAMKLDAKVLAWIIANAVPSAAPAQPTLLKAAAKAVRELKRRKVGRATFVLANDDDFDTLLDYTKNDVPAFMELFPSIGEIKSSPDVPQGTVLAGVKQVGEVKTLPGSPIRASAQHIANGGIDEAFFGYWAIEEHHTQGIASVAYTAPVEP